MPRSSDSQDIKFSGASTSTVLWSGNGFQPNPDIPSVIEELKPELLEKNFEKLVPNALRLDYSLAKTHTGAEFYGEGGHSLCFRLYNEIKEDDFLKKNISAQIYPGDRSEKAKAKFVVRNRIAFDNDLDASETARVMHGITESGKQICEKLYLAIPKKYNLGRICYIATTQAIECGDADAPKILESSLLNETYNYPGVINPRKIDDAYRLMLSEGIIQNYGKDALFDAPLSKVSKEMGLHQSRVTFSVHSNAKIPSKVCNYEPHPHKDRVISCITIPHGSAWIVKQLTNEYVGKT